MANLLASSGWTASQRAAACRFSDVKLHLYGKTDPARQEDGPLTATGRTVQDAQDRCSRLEMRC